MYNPIQINKQALTIMGVKFHDLQTLNCIADALGTNMFEGLNPTVKGVSIIHDFITNKITHSELIQLSKSKAYV